MTLFSFRYWMSLIKHSAHNFAVLNSNGKTATFCWALANRFVNSISCLYINVLIEELNHVACVGGFITLKLFILFSVIIIFHITPYPPLLSLPPSLPLSSLSPPTQTYTHTPCSYAHLEASCAGNTWIVRHLWYQHIQLSLALQELWLLYMSGLLPPCLRLRERLVWISRRQSEYC